MEQGLRDCCRSIRIGKILIQSDEETQKAKVYYAKFPPDVYRRKVLLMYPILSKYGRLNAPAAAFTRSQMSRGIYSCANAQSFMYLFILTFTAASAFPTILAHSHCSYNYSFHGVNYTLPGKWPAGC